MYNESLGPSMARTHQPGRQFTTGTRNLWLQVATATVDEAMLGRVWQEFDYRVDVCRVTHGSYIEILLSKTNCRSLS
jgi:hypothetical protein